MPDETPTTVGRAAFEGAAAMERNLEQMRRASERFMRGAVTAAVQQIELSRGLIEGGLEDFARLSQARTPETFVQAELDVLRRRSERVMKAMQTVSDELARAWGEALDYTQTAARTAAPAPLESAASQSAPQEPVKPVS